MYHQHLQDKFLDCKCRFCEEEAEVFNHRCSNCPRLRLMREEIFKDLRHIILGSGAYPGIFLYSISYEFQINPVLRGLQSVGIAEDLNILVNHL